ncbi:hypothetical protein VTL71DRAFT_11968 [Oculimacula yallundae]|uniref:Uncharacterized protein n=1 Tax=Oculimacula yallundae TaxID=86028 RepID=A0ABR4CRY7_9HELO
MSIIMLICAPTQSLRESKKRRNKRQHKNDEENNARYATIHCATLGYSTDSISSHLMEKRIIKRTRRVEEKALQVQACYIVDSLSKCRDSRNAGSVVRRMCHFCGGLAGKVAYGLPPLVSCYLVRHSCSRDAGLAVC